MEQDGPKSEGERPQTAAPADQPQDQTTPAQGDAKPRARRTTQKMGPWEWNWHPADPQPIRSVSPSDLSPEERQRLENSVGGLSTTRRGRGEKPG